MNMIAATRMRMTPSMPPVTTTQNLGCRPVVPGGALPTSAMAARIESIAKAMSVSSMTRTVGQNPAGLRRRPAVAGAAGLSGGDATWVAVVTAGAASAE